MSIMAISLTAAVQATDKAAAFPESAHIELRIDCRVAATRDRGGGRVEPYGGSDYVFLLGSDRWPSVGTSLPYFYTLDDGRSFFERVEIEQLEFGGGTAKVKFTTRYGARMELSGAYRGGPPRNVKLRGSYILTDGAGTVELNGQCRERAGPPPIRVPKP